MVQKFARTARERIRIDGGGYRREYLRALAQRVEVAEKEVRIMGSKGDLLRTLAAASGVKSVTPGVRSSVLNWRRDRDSNPGYAFTHTRFPSVRLKPLGHLSSAGCFPHRGVPRTGVLLDKPGSHLKGRSQASIFKAAKKALCGISTLPNCRMRFLPSFCFSSSLRLREMSPP